MSALGYVKLYRKILDHEWLNDRPEYRVAWEDILLGTDWKTGAANLSGIGARRYFTDDQWTRFVRRLKDEGMIEDCHYQNRGGRKGRALTATVSNWQKYHASPESGSNAGATQGANAGASSVTDGDAALQAREQMREQRGSNVESKPVSTVRHDAPEALRSKEVKKGSLQTDQLLTTAAPLEGRKLPREMILMHQCPAEYQRTRGQAWHVWRAANGGDDSLEAWADLYHDHDELLAQLARMKERTKADLPTARGWVLQVAKDAARAPQTALDAMTRILNDPAVKRPWSAYVAAFQNARTVETNTSSRDWALDDLAEHPMYGTLVVNELLPGGRAVTPDGFTFELEGCRRCNN